MIVPDFDRTGGYERQAFFLARAHVRRGIPAMLVTNNPWHNPPREVRDGVTIHRLDPTPRHRSNWVGLYRSFLRFLSSHRRDFDVLHAHAFTFLSASCVPIARILKKPILVKVATEQDIREFRTRKEFSFRVFRPMLWRADRFLSLSRAIRDEFVSCGVDEKRIALVPNGVDSDHFVPATSRERLEAKTTLGLPRDAITFLFTGRLVQRKGVDVLLEALPSLASPDVHVVVLGDGDERPALEAQARTLGVSERVTFVGEDPEVRPWLRACDAFVFPSRLEGLPNALLEAMSAGLPVITTKIGGCIDVCEDGSGLLVPPDDVAELAAAMHRFATCPETRRTYAAAARRRIETTFSFDRIVGRLQDVYRAALDERGSIPESASMHVRPMSSPRHSSADTAAAKSRSPL
ncbi:MAG: glycosyltransferase family 4 protein [Planctomycetes bacterium]|nr:glycosyltransferase family 4 protein [Planctomycetota bacterium]